VNLRVHLLPDEFFRCVTHHFCSSGIYKGHQPIRVEPANAFSGRSQYQTRTLFDRRQSLCLLFRMLQELSGLDVRQQDFRVHCNRGQHRFQQRVLARRERGHSRKFQNPD
jgi:hypothetical protein